MTAPFLSRIRIYPVKSLDPVELQEVEIGIHSLKYDREFAMLAEDGRFINGKRTGAVNQLKAEYDLAKQIIHLSARSGGEVESFHMVNDKALIEKYMTTFFGLTTHWLHHTKGELMDIPTACSVSVVSEASLQSLQHDLNGYDLENIRLRFRANLEIGGVLPFWEDKLFGTPGTGIRFKVGDVEMIGVSPRARCNVPPRDPFTGDTDKSFIKSMMKSRADSLPADSLLPQYGNMYHLTVNTYLSETERGKVLRLGDKVEIIETVQLQTT